MRVAPLLPLAFFLTLAACAEKPRPKVFEHRPVVAETIARLESELAAEPKPVASAEELDPERIPGLVHLLASERGRERAIALEEVRGIGDPAVAELARIAEDSEQSAEERMAACEMLGTIGTGLAAESLLRILEQGAEPWMRAQAAWRLGQVGRDEVVPRMLLRMKYELDPSVDVWIADSLAAYRNYAGLRTLWELESTSTEESIARTAAERRAAIASAAGFEDSAEQYRLWFEGDPEHRLPQAAPSLPLRLEVWKRIQSLTEWQLRGVDDARFILCSLGTWAAQPLAEALHDEEVHLRVHVAQCLERMGPRAAEVAGPELVAALDDPSFAMNAAIALGAIRYEPAEPELEKRMAPGHSYELRVACAQALGLLGMDASRAALERVLASAEPIDLRQAVAVSLVELGAGDGAAGALLGFARDPAADRFGAELALERWLRGREDEASKQLLDAWLELALPQGVIPTSGQDEERLAARIELLEASLAQLTGGA